MSDVTIENQQDENRYALLIDGRLVSVLDYRIRDDAISFPHTFTTPDRRGQGWAEKLVDFAIDDVEQHSSRRVVPMCSYVQDWFAQHPERGALLER